MSLSTRADLFSSALYKAYRHQGLLQHELAALKESVAKVCKEVAFNSRARVCSTTTTTTTTTTNHYHYYYHYHYHYHYYHYHYHYHFHYYYYHYHYNYYY